MHRRKEINKIRMKQIDQKSKRKEQSHKAAGVFPPGKGEEKLKKQKH